MKLRLVGVGFRPQSRGLSHSCMTALLSATQICRVSATLVEGETQTMRVASTRDGVEIVYFGLYAGLSTGWPNW